MIIGGSFLLLTRGYRNMYYGTGKFVVKED